MYSGHRRGDGFVYFHRLAVLIIVHSRYIALELPTATDISGDLPHQHCLLLEAKANTFKFRRRPESGRSYISCQWPFPYHY